VVDIEGLADTAGYIDSVTDIAAGAVNEVVTTGKNFIVEGNKVKVEGDSRKAGVYFICPGSPDVAIKAAENLAENSRSKVIGIVPDLDAGRCPASGGLLCKTPRMNVRVRQGLSRG
jgi:hypothetical protein